MQGVPGTEYIHHIKTTDHYQVTKKIDSRTVSFGTYDTLDEALFFRDYFRENNWRQDNRLGFTKTRFIQKLPSGRYSVIRQPNGTKVSYGTFDTLEEAEHQVKLCKRFGWDKRLKPFDCNSHIWMRESYNGLPEYRIWRWTPDGNEYYGSFDNLEDAKRERDILVCCGWDIELACNIDERINNTDEWLDGKRAKGIPLYRPPNGRIDYDKELLKVR